VIDQAFKTYSSGMQGAADVSTAVCVEPDILIVDEALAVGDAKFSRKCYNKIDEFRQAGRTILLVSHDTNTIATFCDHAILLENGQIHEQGEPRHISMVYYRLVFGEPEGAPHLPGSEAPGGERGRRPRSSSGGSPGTRRAGRAGWAARRGARRTGRRRAGASRNHGRRRGCP